MSSWFSSSSDSGVTKAPNIEHLRSFISPQTVILYALAVFFKAKKKNNLCLQQDVKLETRIQINLESKAS